MAKRGPKTLASKGLKPKVQITISISAELHNEIGFLMMKKLENRSEVISQLLELALAIDENQIRE